MKITKSKLMKIIKEELAVVLESSMYGPTRLPSRSNKPRAIRRSNYEDENEPSYDPPEVSAIGIADDPGENPLNRSVQRARKFQSDLTLGINRKPLRPDEAKAHKILKRAGFRSRNPRDQRVQLAMTQNKGWKFSEYGARKVLDDAVEAGEISYETAYAVMMNLERELYEV
ncbi:MAG: hypothetical protein CMI27_02620 [Opitutae bacterium]|nr:hypothetical protein [Opitutae bacterium]|tara:strand:+ start:5959 stop:6471 length:513 start_codon:yes stop_codon:yes gene_type:complete